MSLVGWVMQMDPRWLVEQPVVCYGTFVRVCLVVAILGRSFSGSRSGAGGIQGVHIWQQGALAGLGGGLDE